jgi:cysteine synthase
MNGQHWVHKTQHGDKQNKNKTQKTKSATIMNGQHWVHKTQHGDKENKKKHRKLNRQQSWMDNNENTRQKKSLVDHSWLLPI